MSADKVPFDEVLMFLERKDWKYYGFWNHWRFFIKPRKSDEPPRQIWVDDNGNVNRDDFEDIKDSV